MNLHHYHHIVFDGPLNITVRSDITTESLARIETKLTQTVAILSDLQNGLGSNKPTETVTENPPPGGNLQ